MFEQLAWFDADLATPEAQRFKHFVNHPHFDDFTELRYGQGYQVFCKAAGPVTISITGKLPTHQASANLLPGWHLLPAITVDGPKPVSWLTQGLDADQVLLFNAATQQLAVAMELTKGQAYFVHIRTTSVWTPPLPRNQTTRLVYDGDGGKVKQISPGTTTTHVGEIYEKDYGGTKTLYVFAGSQRLCAVVRGPSTVDYRYYHPDHLGSSNVITDHTGAVVEVAEHTPYGALSRREGPVDAAHKFTGQRQDGLNGLILFPARAYDPQLGRFLQPDPFVQDPGDPQTLNRYSYVRNNPVNLIDPLGYGWFRTFIAAVVAIVVAAVVFVATGGDCPQCAVAAGLATFAAIAGTGGESRSSGSSSSSSSSVSPSPANPSFSGSPPLPGLRPIGPFATFGAGNLRPYPTGPPLDLPELHEVALEVLNIGLMFYGLVGLTRAAAGTVGALTIRQATTKLVQETVVKNVAATAGPVVNAPSQVVRYATSPLKTGLAALGDAGGGLYATTLQEAGRLGGLRIGPWRILFGPKARLAVDRLALERAATSFLKGSLLFGRVISVPPGTLARAGIVQAIEKLSLKGGAVEFLFDVFF